MKRILLSLMIIAASITAAAQTIPQFRPGDKVALIGDSITHGGHYHSYIWLYYMTRFPNMPLTLLNCGIGGDTAQSIEYRLQQDVLAKDPTYITLTFGMNDTGYWDVYTKENAAELSKQKIDAALETFGRIETVLKSLPEDKKIVMIGGSPYDETSAFNDDILPGKNAAICKIIDAQKSSAKRNGWGFVDFNAPLVEISLTEQAKDSSYTFSGGDRIHPDKDGQMAMAYQFLKAQGLAGRKVSHIGINARKEKVEKQEFCRISSVKAEDRRLSFDYLAESLPYPCDSISEHGWGNVHSQRDAMKLVPFMEEFNQEILQVTKLEKGAYRLEIDGVLIDELTSEELAAGINLAAYVNTPQYRQASAIMYMNEERFEVEKRLREYVWMHAEMFRNTDQIWVDDHKGLEKITKAAHDNWFVDMSLYWYRKSYFPEIRQVWQDYMDKLVETIYTVNKPITRKVVLERI